jgi:hypothetical protein
MTPEALGKLKAWVEEVAPKTSEDEPNSPEQAIEIEENISALLQTDDAAQVRSLREMPVRHGSRPLPPVDVPPGKAETERDRQRLTVLRYRLAAPTAFIVRWPNILERLVEGNVRRRKGTAVGAVQRS